MQRSTMALVAIVALLAGGLVASLATRPTAGLDEQSIRRIVSDVLAERDSGQMEVAGIDQDTINPMIEAYLMENPRILERVSKALESEIRAEDTARAREAIASMHDEIYNDPDHVVLGNPNGDVTLVEMFDYNCTYCRSAVPDMAELLAEDKNLRVILKEFPILSQDSVDAARIGVAVSRTGADYWAFHSTLFTGRGKVTREAALDAAEALGLSRVGVELEAQSKDIEAVLQRSYAIAQELSVTGTPTYIIGDEIIPGAIGADALRERIANMRACGKTVCDS